MRILSATIALLLSIVGASANNLREVPVVSVSSGCTGFYVGNGYYVTAGHCVLGKNYFLLSSGDWAIVAEVVTYEDPGKGQRDFALLHNGSMSVWGGVEALPLACDTKPTIGDHVSITGFPEGIGYVAVSGEVASGERPALPDWEHDVFWVVAPILPGASGSPVVNDAGEVIGIAVGLLFPTEFGMVQPIDAVCEALNAQIP